MNVSIQLSDEAQPDVGEAIAGPLTAYNAQKLGTPDRRSLVLALRDENGDIVGGLWGRTALGWLYVEVLAVPEHLRRRGIGTELMSRAESEAIARGCHSAWLDTFEWQARGFYERLGYSCFGELNDYPRGFSRYFMKKVLLG
jgi:GNAT superfamily N-acetyltransferase